MKSGVDVKIWVVWATRGHLRSPAMLQCEECVIIMTIIILIIIIRRGRRRSKVHSSLIFVFFCITYGVIFSFLGN